MFENKKKNVDEDGSEDYTPNNDNSNSKKRKRENYVMQESVVGTKKKSLKGKLNNSKQSIQVTKSFQILDQDSIGKEKDLHPFGQNTLEYFFGQIGVAGKIDPG